MIRSLFILLCIFTAHFSIAQEKKVVFIIVDGIAADVIDSVATPAIDVISKAGGYTKAYVGGEKGGYSETPTISAVGYNTVLTGTWVNKHNVWDNDIAAQNYHYKSIFRFLKDDDSSRTTGIFSSWLDNRTKLVNMEVDFQFDGLELDTINYPHDKERAFMKKIDEAVTDSAASCIRLNAPDLSWIYLEYTDDIGHMYGDDPRFVAAVQNMDRLVGKIYESVEYRRKNFGEDWLVIITTDHGRDSATGKGHGGQTERERAGWIVTNAKHLNRHFEENASIADIMPTIARFMKIKIPVEDAREIDGVPLIGEIHATSAMAEKKGETLKVSWKKMRDTGTAKVWISTTNNYSQGAKDNYVLAGTARVKDQQISIDCSKMKSDFYKVVIQTSSGFLNRWVGATTKKRKG